MDPSADGGGGDTCVRKHDLDLVGYEGWQDARAQVKASAMVVDGEGVMGGERREEGVFVPLKTTLETRSREEVGKVYVTGVPAKLASGVLK